MNEETTDWYREWFAPRFAEEVADILGGAVVLRRGDDAGRFDELVAKGVDLHIEMMDDDTMWMSIQAPNAVGNVTVLVIAKSDLSVSVTEDQTP